MEHSHGLFELETGELKRRRGQIALVKEKLITFFLFWHHKSFTNSLISSECIQYKAYLKEAFVRIHLTCKMYSVPVLMIGV